MDNVVPLRPDVPESKVERRLVTRFGITQEQVRAAIKPLFLLMHNHGIDTVSLDRNGTKAVVTIDGERL